MSQTNLTGTVTYVAVNSASYWAIKSTGILEKFPGYEQLLDSGKDIQIALAMGGALTVSQELLKLVFPETYGQSTLATGQLLAFADHTAFNGLICLAMVKTEMHQKIGEIFEPYVPPEIGEALANGVAIGVAEYVRGKLIMRAQDGGEAGWIRWVLQPLSSISAMSGMGMQ